MRIRISAADDFLSACCIFLTLSPMYIWGNEIIIYGATLPVFLFCTRNSFIRIEARKLFSASVVFFCALVFLYLSGASYVGIIYFSVFIFAIIKLPDAKLISIFNYLKLIIAFSLIPGILLWLVHHTLSKSILYLGALSLESVPDSIKISEGVGYAIYPFAVVLDYALMWPIYRLQGPFDEPGWLGTICALLLASSGFKKNKLTDKIILLAGILSFSLAFYILFFLFLLMNAKGKFLKYSLLVSMSIVVIYYLLPDAFDRYVAQRLVINEGAIAGYNRDTLHVAEEFSNFWNLPLYNIIFGLPAKISDGSASFKLLLLNTGLMGALIIFSIYAFLIQQNRRVVGKRFLSFFIIFLMSGLQRPDIVKPFMVFIFLVAPFMLKPDNLKNSVN